MMFAWDEKNVLNKFESPFTCIFCDDNYSTFRKLCSHYNKFHAHKSCFKLNCPLKTAKCLRKFSSTQTLIKHLRIYHSAQYKILMQSNVSKMKTNSSESGGVLQTQNEPIKGRSLHVDLEEMDAVHAPTLEVDVIIENESFTSNETTNEHNVQTSTSDISKSDETAVGETTPEITPTFYSDVVQRLITEQDILYVINWLQETKLLASEMKCVHCLKNLNWTKHAKCVDKYIWRCRNGMCKKKSTTVSIRNKSFFAKSKMSLQKCIHGMFLWSNRIGEKAALNMVGISEKTMVEMYNFFRKVCVQYFVNHPVTLGGMYQCVEIDESCFVHKVQKVKVHEQDRNTLKPVWVFGIVQRSADGPGNSYLEVVEHRDVERHLSILRKVVLPDTKVYSKEWRVYSQIQDNLELQHDTIYPKFHFVGPETEVNTNTVDTYWKKCKNTLRIMRGCRRHLLHSYLQEFMWRDRFNDDAFNNFCCHISEQYHV